MRTVVLAVAVAVPVAALSSCSRDAASPRVADGKAAALLHERVWIDQEPVTDNHAFHVLFFETKKFGIYQDRTIWKGEFERFRYEAKDGRLTLKLPGSKRTVKTGFKIEKAKRGQADYRLTLEQAATGPTVYYGYKFDGDAAGADAWIEATFGDADK